MRDSGGMRESEGMVAWTGESGIWERGRGVLGVCVPNSHTDRKLKATVKLF